MSYFVVERSGDGGVLHIPLPTAFETREAAIAALSAATGSGEVTLTGEVFIADLGSAVPVLVMAAPVPVAPVETSPEESLLEAAEDEAAVEPAAEATTEIEAEEVETVSDVSEADTSDFIIEDAEPEPEALDEQAADEVYTSWEPIPDVTTGGSTLADALKRATTTLEDEGVVAPDSIVAGPDLDEVPVDDVAEVVPSLGEPPIAEAIETEAAEEWPWANVQSYEVPAQESDIDAAAEVADPTSLVAEPAGVPAAEGDIQALVESLAEDAPIITSAPPEGEEVYVPHPVILGDYGDAPSVPEDADLEATVPVEEEPEEIETAELPDIEIGEPADVADVAAVDAVAPSLEGGYAPTGDLDLGEYTCQDCVYSNTCPKVGEVTPAECGSFQWKSE